MTHTRVIGFFLSLDWRSSVLWQSREEALGLALVKPIWWWKIVSRETTLGQKFSIWSSQGNTRGWCVTAGWGHKSPDLFCFRLNPFVTLLVLNVLSTIWSCGTVRIHFVRWFLGSGWEKRSVIYRGTRPEKTSNITEQCDVLGPRNRNFSKWSYFKWHEQICTWKHEPVITGGRLAKRQWH